MNPSTKSGAAILGTFIFLGLGALGFFLYTAAIQHKMYERSVRVKGLCEREYPADIVIWPIQFSLAGNDLADLYSRLDSQASQISRFLLEKGITKDEITTAAPGIRDKSAQSYGGSQKIEFRYTATRTVTVYSPRIEEVRKVMGALSRLGKKGIVFTGASYQSQTEYLFTRLNDVKPEMIEEATQNARQVAKKFASDSKSRLGKIKKASQGRFSISDRDKNNPHIKRVRVVSTIEYYLSD